jgi:flagellar assembly protein FliH
LSKLILKDVVVSEFSSLLKAVPPKEIIDKLKRTDNEIDTIKAEAYKVAYAAGLEEGKLVGRNIGFTAGHAEGFELAFEEAAARKQAELDALTADFEKIIATINGAMQEWFVKSEPALAQVSTLIAKRVLARELKLAPDSILAITKEALAEVTHANSARIRINPADSGILEEHRAELMAAAESVRQLEIVSDEDIPGGCVIETDGGVVDAQIDMRLEEIVLGVRKAA